MEENLMTIEEFNSQVARWASHIQSSARSTVAPATHGTGNLAMRINRFIDKNDRDEQFRGAAYKVAFSFPRYGVFRAYGAGRGWVCRNGTLMRGTRLRSERDIKMKRWSDLAKRYQARGFTTSEVNRMKVYSPTKKGNKERKPLDWLDRHIAAGFNRLADITANFYGDHALKALIDNFDKSKIVK